MPFLHNSVHLWRVWRAGVRVNIIREIAFRANFIFGITRQVLWLATFIFFIEVVFRNTETLAGWNQAEVLVVLALSRLIEGLINTLFSQNIMGLPELVQKGTFDFYLTKPVPAQFYMAFRNFSLYNVGNVVAGIVLLFYAVWHLPQFPSPSSWGLFVVLAACGITIYYSLLIMVSSLVFYLERLEALWGFMVLFSEPLTVPFDVFPRTPRLTLTYLIPIAFVVFVPAQTLTGRLVWWQVPVALIITGIFLTLANLAWRAGLRRYSSASS
ncbi:MAG: ABC-2 family transporter protein [Candidatus Andersenbacteria bacterium]